MEVPRLRYITYGELELMMIRLIIDVKENPGLYTNEYQMENGSSAIEFIRQENLRRDLFDKNTDMSTDRQIIESAKTELTRSMKLAAEREEYGSSADMKRILNGLSAPSDRTFTENEISQLQSEVHKITGNGEVMQLFNKLLGINAA